MKIVARENRPYSDRIVAENVGEKSEGKAMVAALNSTELAIRIGRRYRLIEDDDKIMARPIPIARG